MFFTYLSNFIQNNITGCWHSDTYITKVQVSATIRHPQYCVLSKCKRCNSDCNNIIIRPNEDKKSSDAAAWLVQNNFDFTSGKPLNEK